MRYVTNGQRDYSGGREQLRKRAKRNRFGFFGQLVDNKGVWLLLQAVQQLRAEGFTDFVVEINGGNLNYASEARRAEIDAFLGRESALPVTERIVFFNGSYSVDQLEQRMARIDWCIMPSVWWEVFGLVISEAWMFRRPIIASNVGAMAERISHDKDGLLFDVGDASALAQSIRRACTEKGLWDRLAKSIKAPPTVDTMVQGFLSVYRDKEARRHNRLPADTSPQEMFSH
jgi:glycosyltransferase involved in cell wall biosynthesis